MSKPDQKRKYRIRTHGARVTAEVLRRIERTPTGRILLAEVRHQNRTLRAAVTALADSVFVHRASREDLERIAGHVGLDLL